MLFPCLLALLALIIFNIFFNFKIFNIFVSILGISIFAGYILYDISLLKYDIEQGNIVDRDDLSIHVLNLYLDFVNLLLDLLRLVREFVK
ncbi:Bax inhibitor-1 family protein [Romboutsia lituseburensis]|nr:Bax inhibitor-1 family protein [Romboutsia lituseburensis]